MGSLVTVMFETIRSGFGHIACSFLEARLSSIWGSRFDLRMTSALGCYRWAGYVDGS